MLTPDEIGIDMLTQERLKELLHYDPNTGLFTWARSRPGCRGGTVAGSHHKDGYWRVRLDRRDTLAHRLAFLYMTGEWPKEHVDHINGVRTDNRWVNLRDIPRAVNMQNQRAAHIDSAVPFLGVHKSGRKFVAQIRQGPSLKYLGLFATAEEAHQAYLTAKRELHAGCTV